MSTPNRPKKGTQAARVLALLERHPAGVCALDILTGFDTYRISHRYAAPIERLRKAGYQITTIQCPYLWHTHAPNLAFYRLEEPNPYAAGTLFGSAGVWSPNSSTPRLHRIIDIPQGDNQ